MVGAIRFQVAPIVDSFIGFAALTGAATGLFCSIAKRRHHREEEAEQGGAGQPATRSDSKSEVGDKPQPEAEGRSR